MKSSELHGALVVAALTLSGCNSTGVGNPATPGELELGLVSDDNPEPDASDVDDTLPRGAVSKAALGLAELRLLPCDASVEPVILPGPFVLDLVAQTIEPSPGPAAVPPGGFCGVDAPLEAAKRPAWLAGSSLLYSGVRADGVPFLLFASVPGTLKLRARPGVSWPRDSGAASREARSAHVFWAFRPRRWVTPRELDAMDPYAYGDGRRIILIDVDRAPLLYRAIVSRLAGRSGLYEDADGDGRVDPRELTLDHWVGIGLVDTQ
jgi:hypothetical protein